MPSRNTIEIVINATDNASRVFNSLSDNTQTIGKTIGLGLAAGIGVATTAIAGFATKGLQEFVKFQSGMQEVFSLLPGISQEAMDKLDQQVKDISTRFGTLPEEVVPAFYEALSAGIPPDNVFTFVETANKAAIAGVTDLATAVSGISSVVNAYGADILDAGKASDLMFQAVKLGKTTFEELSQSLYNVTPTASALGVTFEDVSAQLAAITAVGVPTSVATTQMRQLFIELSKAGGKVDETFQQLAGKTFKQFIAEGHTTQDALKLLEQHAKDTGVGVNDLFSSVEAGAAALALTGQNSARYTDFLNQMNEAAGATDQAFQTMSESLQFQINRTNAKFNVLLITVGEKLAPAFDRPAEVIGNLIGWFTDLIDGGTSLTDFMSYDIPEAFRPFLTTILDVVDKFKYLSDQFITFTMNIQKGMPFLDALWVFLANIGSDKDNTAFADTIQAIGYAIQDVIKFVRPIINAVTKWIKENVKLEDVLTAVGIALASYVIPAIIAIGAAIAPIIVTFGVLVGAVTLLRKAWENNFLGIRDFVLNKLIPALQSLADWFINTALPAIIDFIQNTAIPVIQTFIMNLIGIWESVRPGLEALVNWFINDALPSAIDFVQNIAIPAIQYFIHWLSVIWENVKPSLQAIGDWFMTTVLPAIVAFIQNVVIPGIGKFVDFLVGIWNIVSPALGDLYNWFVTTALPAVIAFVENTVIPGIQKLVDFLLGLWATVQPELQKLYDWFVTTALPALIRFVEETIIPGIQGLANIILGVWEFVRPELEKLYNWFVTDALPAILNFIDTTVLPGIQAFMDLIAGVWDFVSPALQSFFDWFTVNGLPAIRNFIENTFITPFRTMRNLISNIWNVVQTPLENLKNGFDRIFSWIKTNVIDPIIGRIQEFITTLQNLGIIAGNTQATVNAAVANATTNPGSAVSDPSGLFGNYNGLAFAPRTQARIVHQGERILTADENKDYSSNQSNTPMIHIENFNLGSIENQNDANDKARMFVNALRSQGLEIG